MSDLKPNEPGIGELLAQLADDAKSYGRAELDYYYALARDKLRGLRFALWTGALAAALAFAAAVALVLGLILTLAPVVGPGWATVIVVGTALALAGILARLAWLRIKRILTEKP